MPYIMIGEGGYNTHCATFFQGTNRRYMVQRSYITQQLENRVPMVINRAVHLIPVDTPFFFLGFNAGFVDSLTQVLFEDETSGSLVKGLSKGLISLLASTNHKRVIVSYAPVMSNQENDPLRQIAPEGYSAGSLLVRKPFTKTTNILTYELYSTSRVLIGTSQDAINLKEDGDINRDLVMPILMNGHVYGPSLQKDMASGTITELSSLEYKALIPQTPQSGLFEISLSGTASHAGFKVLQL